MKKLNIPMLTPIVALLLFFIWHLVMTMTENREIEEYYKNGSDDFEFNFILVKASDGGMAVMNTDSGVLVKKNYFRKYNDMYIKVTPNRVEIVDGTILWRFFRVGVIFGDSDTLFTAKHWWNPRTANEASHFADPRLGIPPTFLNQIQLDPSNPTPFWILVLVAIGTFIMKPRGKRN